MEAVRIVEKLICVIILFNFVNRLISVKNKFSSIILQIGIISKLIYIKMIVLFLIYENVSVNYYIS